MIKLVSKNKYTKIRDSVSSNTDVFLVKCGLLLSRPNNGNVITRDNIKIEVNIICNIKISKKKQLSFLFDTISNKS